MQAKLEETYRWEAEIHNIKRLLHQQPHSTPTASPNTSIHEEYQEESFIRSSLTPVVRPAAVHWDTTNRPSQTPVPHINVHMYYTECDGCKKMKEKLKSLRESYKILKSFWRRWTWEINLYTECKYGGPLGRRPGRVMKVRLVRPRCFVLTMLPLKSLASWTG